MGGNGKQGRNDEESVVEIVNLFATDLTVPIAIGTVRSQIKKCETPKYTSREIYCGTL